MKVISTLRRLMVQGFAKIRSFSRPVQDFAGRAWLGSIVVGGAGHGLIGSGDVVVFSHSQFVV